MKVGIYGLGNFGFAILKHLHNKKDSDLKLIAYDRNEETTNHLIKHRKHPFLHTGVIIPKSVNIVQSPDLLLDSLDVLIMAVPSEATREAIETLNTHLDSPLILVNTAKALDYVTGRRLSEIYTKKLHNPSIDYICIAGGTIARDLFMHEPLGVDIAGKNMENLKTIKELFCSDNLAVYPTSDLIGVEFASSLKNVVSIIAGIIKGLGFSYGSETHIISRVAQLLSEVCVEKGAKKQTFSIGSQCWGNDLWMSCTGNTRNREFGVLLGKGLDVGDAIKQMKSQNKTVEGLSTIKILYKTDGFRNIQLIPALHDYIIDKKMTAKEFHETLTDSVKV